MGFVYDLEFMIWCFFLVTQEAVIHLCDSVKSVGFHIHRDKLCMATHAAVLPFQDHTMSPFKMIVAGTFCGHLLRQFVAAQTGLIVDGWVRFRGGPAGMGTLLRDVSRLSLQFSHCGPSPDAPGHDGRPKKGALQTGFAIDASEAG